MDALIKLSTLMGLSLTSGINLYATVAVVGLVTKYDVVKGLPVEFQAFNNDNIIALAILLYIVEFFADKIPGFDTLWDSLHTFIRPVGSAFITLTAMGESDQSIEIITVLLCSFLALCTHTVKMGTRLVVNMSPEPFSNTAVSVGEDIAVAALAWASLAHPVVSSVLSLFFILLLLLYGPGLFRITVMVLKAVPVRLSTFFTQKKAETLIEFIPDRYEDCLENYLGNGDEMHCCLPCRVMGIKEAGRYRSGFIVITERELFFVYRKFFKIRAWVSAFSGKSKVKTEKKLLFDIIHFRDNEISGEFIFFKNRTLQVMAVAEFLKEKTNSR